MENFKKKMFKIILKINKKGHIYSINTYILTYSSVLYCGYLKNKKTNVEEKNKLKAKKRAWKMHTTGGLRSGEQRLSVEGPLALI